MIHFEIDIEEVDRELKRLAEGPSEEDLLALDSILSAVAVTVRASVHIQTGSLRASGQADAEYKNKKWKGEITYGGKANGYPHNPVDYASVEQERGGDHDFLRFVDEFDEAYEEAILEFFRGRG